MLSRMRGILFLPPGHAPPPRSSGPVRIDVPRESIDGEAVVLAGGAEEGTREDVVKGDAFTLQPTSCM